MPFKIDDRVQQSIAIGGLGNIIFNGTGAVPGWDTFGAVLDVGDTTWYFAYDPIAFLWEVGLATYTAGDQLQRTTIFDSSTGEKINFPGNVCQVAMTIPAAFITQTIAQSPSGSAYTFGTISFGAGSVAQPGTITITLDQDVNAHLLEVNYTNGSGGGTIDAAVHVNGSTLAGFGAIAITGAGSLTGSGEVPAGSSMTVVFTNASGTLGDGAAITFSGTQD
jgi:hypothetical protein